MPANFSSLRLSYNFWGDSDEKLNFSLHSINFDINQARIGANTPFTSEISAELKLEKGASVNSFSQLNVLLNDSSLYEGQNLPQGSRVVDKTTSLFKDFVFNYLNDNLSMQYLDIGPTDDRLIDEFIFESSVIQVLINPIQDEGQKLFDWAWNVKLKFHANWEGNTKRSIVPADGSDPFDMDYQEEAAVFYPRLSLPIPIENANREQSLTDDKTTLLSFNDELRLNYELLYQRGDTSSDGVVTSNGVANSIGKASDELTDSISSLANTLNTNLSSTFTTRLQPAGSSVTNDLALWVLILKGTEAMSFKRFDSYMNAIFCNTDHSGAAAELATISKLAGARSLPFMNIDAYRCVKIAAEAFVVVNCMVDGIFTDDDVQSLKDRVPLKDGNFDKTALDKWWGEYQVKLNFRSIVEDAGGNLSVLEQQVSTIPYLAVIRSKLKDQDLKLTPFDAAFSQYLNPATEQTTNTCFGIISEKIAYPCYLELIWSYWHEESMMVQGLNAISRRFQNMKGTGRDPLAHLELDPLRPLNNLLWGYIQDEQHRLTVRRRAYEYDHHYGIRLQGTATKNMQFADSRSKFIEAFHRLLNLVSRFYNQADDMTVNPDAYPVLNGLKEVHMILSEGAHNQYGDMPSTARAEMLMQQWLLARPEFRQFLSGRTMVAYPEDWMEPVATANTMMGWTKASPLHFRNLARFGEQLLLSVRFGNWADITDRKAAANWSHFWREQIQGYIHAYRAVTNVDLSLDTSKVDINQPSYHLLRQLKAQRNGRNRA